MTRRLLAVVVPAAALLTLATPALAAPAADSALVDTSPCPPGDSGVVVGTLGRQLVVCTNI